MSDYRRFKLAKAKLNTTEEVSELDEHNDSPNYKSQSKQNRRFELDERHLTDDVSCAEKIPKPKKKSRSINKPNMKKLATKVQLDDDEQDESGKSNAQQGRRTRSARRSANSMMSELGKMISENFSYEIKQVDLNFIFELFTQLPSLKEIWSRIGFNKETKSQRLNKFYEQLYVIH
jgi:hypothetical protein